MPNVEAYTNGSVTTLLLSIGATDTTAYVDSAVGFPSSGDFRVKVGDEIIKVTAVSGTTWTIVRGAEGTAAVAHGPGTFVHNPVTAEALSRLVVEMHGGAVVQARRRLNFLDTGTLVWTLTDDPTNEKMDISAAASGGGGGGGGGGLEDVYVAPALADFSWFNQGGATATTRSAGGIHLLAPPASGNNLRCLEIAPTAPWTVVARIQPNNLGADGNVCGVYFRDSTGGRMVIVAWYRYVLDTYHFNGPTSYSSTVRSVNTQLFWVRLKDTGVNLTVELSADGLSWIPYASEARTSWLAAPDRVGFWADSNSSTYSSGVLLLSWALS